MTKICIKCKIEMPIETFSKDKNKKDGLSNRCKKCRCEESRQYRKENFVKVKNYQNQYQKENSEKIRERRRQYREENSEKISEQRKQYYKENSEEICKQRKQYYEENSEKINERKKQYYEENSEEICEQKRQYRKENFERLRKHEKQYYTENFERMCERIRRYRKTPKGRLVNARTCTKRRMRKLNNGGICDLTLNEWNAILKHQNYKCIICGKPFTEKYPATQDHIIPLSKGGYDTANNIQGAHRYCNSTKSNKIDKTNILTYVNSYMLKE